MARKLDVTVVTSLVGAGLEREYLLLRELLMTHGDYVMGVHYTDMSCELHPSDIMVSLEVVSPRTLNLSRNNWFAPNPEWYDSKNDRFLPQFNKIICKTKDCYDIWCRKVGPEKCVFTSFEARDIYRPEIPREVKCLHIAGKSEFKNTDAVLRAWRLNHLAHILPLPPLTVIARAPLFDDHFKPEHPFPDSNVTVIPRAIDEQVIELMNNHKIHVIPSMYEGFGHVIHEGLGCKALVLTTDAPPMNSYAGIIRECIIPSTHQTPRALAQLNHVSPQAVEDAVRRASNFIWSHGDKADAYSEKARAGFLENRDFFRRTFMGLVDGVR